MEAKVVRNLVFSGVLLVLSLVFVTGTLKVVQKGDRLIESKKELESLRQEKMALEKEAQYRKSPEFIEKEARNRLNMVKPGEEVYLRPKILGDDLLGDHTTRGDTGETRNGFAPIGRLFDRIKEFLLLFQG